MSINQEQQSQPATPGLAGLIAELRQRRDELEAAEPHYEQQGTHLTKAYKRGTASQVGAKQRRKTLDDEAQAIHDRLRNARLDVQDTLRRLSLAVGVRAIRDEAARGVLDQLKQLSPYPSVRIADDALALVEKLNGPGLGTVGAASGASLATIESLPRDEPSAVHRRTLAALLEQIHLSYRP